MTSSARQLRWLVLCWSLSLKVLAGESMAVFPKPDFAAIKPGLDFAELKIASIPWRICIVRLDRHVAGLQLRSTLGGGRHFGLATVPAQARATTTPGWTPLAAINGGYFREARGFERGTLAGLLILDGEIVSRPANTTFWVDATNGLHIAVIHPKMEIVWPDGEASPLGLNELPATNRPSLITRRFGARMPATEGLVVELHSAAGQPWPALRPNSNYLAKARRLLTPVGVEVPVGGALLLAHPAQAGRLERLETGSLLRFSTALSQDLSPALTALGAGPTLLTEGITNEKLLAPKADQRRNPRTAVGFNARYCFLVVVDGRALSSAGMTYAELARFLAQLGCTEAMNLDGGTSTTMWLNGKVVNSPSGWITPAVADALVVLRRTTE
jgi:hypothetical protein